jgi:hypothetical protein
VKQFELEIRTGENLGCSRLVFAVGRALFNQIQGVLSTNSRLCQHAAASGANSTPVPTVLKSTVLQGRTSI